MDDEEIQTKKQFTVVMRGPSAVLFRQDDYLRVKDFPSAIGPVNIVYRARWLKRDENIIVPGNLWIEINGSGPALEEVLAPFANAGLAMIPILSLSVNAAIGEPEVELGFDITPGITVQDYFQSYVPPESHIVHLGRHINVDATVALIRAIAIHPDGERLRRAANQYRLALDSWRFGRDTLSLAHLWMAVEALTKARLLVECAVRGFQEDQELANSLGVELKHLDATIRKNLILKGDEKCYEKSKEASDGFEHGYLGYDEIRELAKDVRHRMAAYVRTAILEMIGVDADTFKLLTSNPFDKPMGYWPIVKYIRGRLIGAGEELAAEGNSYPFIKWNPVVKSSQVGEDGKLNITFNETFTAEIAKGILFEPQLYEAWQPE